jgi:hypothetical protein
MTTQAPPQFDVKPGLYKVRGIQGSQEYGDSKEGHPQLLILVTVPDLNRDLTTALSFHPNSAQYSLQRLRALGCESTDLSQLTGLDAKEPMAKIYYDDYGGKSQLRVEIQTGGGQFHVAKPVDPKVWAARVAAILGNGAAAGGGAKEEVPFLTLLDVVLPQEIFPRHERW